MHVGRKFKEALSLCVLKVQTQDPQSESSLNCVLYIAGSPHPSVCPGWDGLWVPPSSDTTCGHAVHRTERQLLGEIWNKSKTAGGFLAAVPSLFSLPGILWKVPLAGCEMSQLISWVISMSISTPGPSGEMELSHASERPPPHVCMRVHPHPIFQ